MIFCLKSSNAFIQRSLKITKRASIKHDSNSKMHQIEFIPNDGLCNKKLTRYKVASINTFHSICNRHAKVSMKLTGYYFCWFSMVGFAKDKSLVEKKMQKIKYAIVLKFKMTFPYLLGQIFSVSNFKRPLNIYLSAYLFLTWSYIDIGL